MKETRIANDVIIGANVELKNSVIIESGTEISAGAVLNGPLYIGPNSYIGNNTLIRDHCSIGEGTVVGFGSEIKNSILFEGAKIFGLCYVGDSVIGKDTILSSGVITVNNSSKGNRNECGRKIITHWFYQAWSYYRRLLRNWC